MDLDEACKVADIAVSAKIGRNLSDVQKFILRGALQGQTYEQIAESSNYSVSYLKKYVGHSLWKLLSEALDEKVSKTNFREALEREFHRCSAPPVVASPPLDQNRIRQTTAILIEVPHIPVFFGRTDELIKLEQWLTKDSCRIVLLSGIGGIGKTALAAKLSQQIRSDFEYIIWQSLREAPRAKTVVNNLVNSFFYHSGIDVKKHVDSEFLKLTHYLNRHRSLIVLDDFESILHGGEIAGQYQEIYKEYDDFIRELTTEHHKSCLLLISREQPAEIAAQSGDSLPIRSLKIKNLSIEDAKSILETKGISRIERGVEDLIQLYRGNPSILKIVSTTIKELFNGSISQFLKQNTILLDDLIINLIQEQFERLSDLEKGVIYCLAIEEKSVNISQIKENSKFLVSTSSELMKILQSLKRRSFLEEELREEENEVMFTLQPMLKKYVVNRLFEQICNDISSFFETKSIRKIGLIKTNLLFSSHTQNSISTKQNFLCPKLMIESLTAILNSEISLKTHLQEILLSLEKEAPHNIGHAIVNILYLIENIEG